MPTHDDLISRVDALEKRVRSLQEKLTVDGEASLRKMADDLALFDGIMDIAVKCGFDVVEFGKHLDDLKKKYHHSILKKIEGFDPWAAGILDTRKIEDATDESD